MKLGKQKIKCRSCGTLLTINVTEENMNKSLRCPICKKIAPLAQYEIMDEKEKEMEANRQTPPTPPPAPAPAPAPTPDEETRYGQTHDNNAVAPEDHFDRRDDYISDILPPSQTTGTYTRDTELVQEQTNNQTKDEIGLLVIEKSNRTYQLKEGCNIIGRNGEGTEADFKIDTPNEKKISREHIIIDVNYCDNKYNYLVKLYKKEVNATYINGNRLEYGDCINLMDGDIIDLPGVKLHFIKP